MKGLYFGQMIPILHWIKMFHWVNSHEPSLNWKKKQRERPNYALK